MFGIGLGELAVIMVLAALVFGPDKVPELARQAGRLLRQVRRMANDARDELRTELGPDYANLELRDLDPRTIVRKHIADAMADDDDDDGEKRTDDDRPARPATRQLAEGERPPWDSDAT